MPEYGKDIEWSEVAPCYWPTGIRALDRVLGGGFVPGRVILFGSPEGAGKTSLLLQACDGFARLNKMRALVASVDLSSAQVTGHAARLGLHSERVHLLTENCVRSVFKAAREVDASLVVFDSLRGLVVEPGETPGTPAAMARAFAAVMAHREEYRCAAVVAYHFAKNGAFAGRQEMMHAADGLLRLDPLYGRGYGLGVEDTRRRPTRRATRLRLLSWEKSRQCSVDLRGVLELTERGFVDVNGG